MQRIETHSVPLSSLTEHARGEEISADGLLWQCSNCLRYTVPGEKQKGGRYRNKACPNCGATLSEIGSRSERIVGEFQNRQFSTSFIDGSSLTSRYEIPTRRFIRTDLIGLKDHAIFIGPKILIRQAGVGLTATLCADDARCPQSVYIYRLNSAATASGYTLEFLLAALVSRTMNYFVLKRFAEADPARAFAKVTHQRLADLPIPAVLSPSDKNIVSTVTGHVRNILNSQRLGGVDDMNIEVELRRMWGMSPDEGAYVNGVFAQIPTGQLVRDLFPGGAPSARPFPTPPQSHV
jgi:TaqI-like C-terminal specificity domain